MTKYIDLVPVLSTLISHFVIIKSTRPLCYYACMMTSMAHLFLFVRVVSCPYGNK